jgi:hypothetical protein
LYSSPNIIEKVKTREIRWDGHVQIEGRGLMRMGYWWESQKKRDH